MSIQVALHHKTEYRYDRLVKSAGQAMSGDARAAMKDLVDHGTN